MSKPSKKKLSEKSSKTKVTFGWSDVLHVSLAITVAQLAGVIGSLFTFPSLDSWYDVLIKPVLVPPNWLFGPVWITLFCLMGIAKYLACRFAQNERESEIASRWWYVQLAFNTAWSIVFFGFQQLWWGFLVIVILWLSILYTTVLFWRQYRWAGILMVPYLLWVTFASYLNFSLAMLN